LPPKREYLTEKNKILWEMISVVHSFSGSIMVGAVSTLNTSMTLWLVLGLALFLLNFIFIFLGIKSGKRIWERVDNFTLTFSISMLTMVFFLMTLFRFANVLVTISLVSG
jgi:hypothetical protein